MCGPYQALLANNDERVPEGESVATIHEPFAWLDNVLQRWFEEVKFLAKDPKKPLAIIILLLVVVYTVKYAHPDREHVRAKLEEVLSRPVALGTLNWTLFPPSVEVHDLSIYEDENFRSATPFIQASRATLVLRVRPLLRGTVEINSLTLHQPRVNLTRNQSGVWNFVSFGAVRKADGRDSKCPLLRQLVIENGELAIADAKLGQKKTLYRHIDITIRDFARNQSFPVDIAAHFPGTKEFRIQGRVGPINSVNVAATPLDAHVHIKGFDLRASEFINRPSGVAGVTDWDASLASDGKHLQVNGTLKADKLKLAEQGSPASLPVEVNYALTYDVQTQSGTLTEGDVSVGKARVRVTGNFQAFNKG